MHIHSTHMNVYLNHNMTTSENHPLVGNSISCVIVWFICGQINTYITQGRISNLIRLEFFNINTIIAWHQLWNLFFKNLMTYTYFSDTWPWINCCEACCKLDYWSWGKSCPCMWSSFWAIYGLFWYTGRSCLWSGMNSCYLILNIYMRVCVYVYMYVCWLIYWKLACHIGLLSEQDDIIARFSGCLSWCWRCCTSSNFCKETIRCTTGHCW